MRVRLVSAFTLLAAICMICFAIGIGYEVANSRTQGLLIDRIQDANRFAAMASANPSRLDDEAQSYYERTGNGILVIANSGRLMVELGVDRGNPRVVEVSSNTHQFVPPETLYPWSTHPMIVAQPIGTWPQAGGSVIIAISTSATRGDITDSWIQLGCVTATALLVFCGLALAVSGWILRPVSKLLRDVEALTSTLPICAEPRRSESRAQGPPEIIELAVGVQAVTRAVAELAAAERQLVVDTAHSLRNPLAALAVRLQALQPMIAQDHAAATFVGVVSEVDRLTALLDGLLSSAVAEAKSGRAAQPTASTCDAVVVARDRVEAWHDAFIRADMTVTLETLADVAEAAVPGNVLTQILDVALSNSARYAGRDARTTITVVHEGESVVVSVGDDGVGVSPDELDQLTTRFFRGTQAGAGGSGLGLPIAATMVAQYGGLFFVDAAEPCGLVVTAGFPAVDPAPANLTSR
ncbi:sensor histidine kinase [Nocardia salmonicida]|uniref:sensor histidine kinase n=1 Tax=Nocardia salmonicida TaxID=53431 RepID=UPI003CF2F8D5